MKRVFIMALMAAALTTAGAQEKKGIQLPSWLSNVKLSGYGMLQYQYNGQKGAESNSFNVRMGRISLEGRIAQDFYWKTPRLWETAHAWWISSPSGRNMSSSR